MLTEYLSLAASAKYHVSGNLRQPLKEIMSIFDAVKFGEEYNFYGKDKVLEAFEEDMAAHFGKEASVFLYSNELALAIAHAVSTENLGGRRLGVHTCKVEDAKYADLFSKLLKTDLVGIGEKNSYFTLDDIKAQGALTAIIFDLAQKSGGYIAPTWKQLVEMADYCQDEGMKMHLDATLLEYVTPYFNRSPKQVADLFDSVSLDFSIYSGAIGGAVLVGSADFIESCKRWRRYYAANLRHIAPYLYTAKFAFESRTQDFEGRMHTATQYAASLAEIDGFKIMPDELICPGFAVSIERKGEEILHVLKHVVEKHGVSLFGDIEREADGRILAHVLIGESMNMLPKTLLNIALGNLKDLLQK